jgi:hypothetical protein
MPLTTRALCIDDLVYDINDETIIMSYLMHEMALDVNEEGFTFYLCMPEVYAAFALDATEIVSAAMTRLR